MPQGTVFTIALLIMLSSYVNAEKKFLVTIEISPEIHPDNLTISYDNGVETTSIPSTFKANKMSISGQYVSEFVGLELSYPNPNDVQAYYHCFFIKDSPAIIKFISNKAEADPLGSFTLFSAFDYEAMGGRELNAFISREKRDFWEFYKTNVSKLSSNDSLVKVFFGKGEKVKSKTAEFVRNNGSLYYSFWLFRREVAYYENIAADTLVKIFDTSFPSELKNSPEGLQIKTVLNGRTLRKGREAPLFEIKDINGKLFSLKSLRGKYVLINCWATWCGPCVDELPTISSFKSKYGNKNFETIYVSRDKDATDSFRRLIQRYDMNGIHIICDSNLMRLYGAYAIPKVFLIDPDGVILYSSDDSKDGNISILTEQLEKAFGKG